MMDTSADDFEFVQRAIRLAESALQAGSGAPIGCVIVLDGKLIGEGENRVAEACDPTAHAEIVAMRNAGERLGRPRFEGATLYSTLQPCGMCTMAAIWAGVSRIVYGAGREQVHEMYFENRHLNIDDFIRDAFKDDLTLNGGVLGEQCARLYYGPEDEPPGAEQANK